MHGIDVYIVFTKPRSFRQLLKNIKRCRCKCLSYELGANLIIIGPVMYVWYNIFLNRVFLSFPQT